MNRTVLQIVSSTKAYGGNAYEFNIGKSASDCNFIYFNIFKPFGTQITINFFLFFKLLFRADLIITNSTGFILYPIIRLFKLTIVLIIHHVDNRGSPPLSRLLQKLEWIVFRCFASRDIKIITVSTVWKRIFNKLGYNNVSVIYNGFNIEKYTISQDSRVNILSKLGLSGKKLIYIGNPLKRKGVLELIEAFKNSEYQLVATGVSSDVEDSEILRIFNLDFEDYLSLLSSCSIACLFSNFREGWNRTAHECVLLKVPLIGSPRGGMRELLEVLHQTKICTPAEAFIYISENSFPVVSDFDYKLACQYNNSRFDAAWSDVINGLIVDIR
jgi:glycosyltransferase involved in cell wall biosynthesis